MSDTDIALQEEIAPASSVAMPSLLDNVMAQTRFQPASESYDITRQGVTAFIAAMLESNNDEEPVDILAVNAMIADIDDRMGRQMDLLVHSPEFQELESFLLSLKLLVDRADPRENIKIHVLHATKEELLDDFEFAPEITQSAFYRHVYSSGFGQFGGEPVAAIIGNYAFKNSTADMKLLKYISAVSAMAHSPFLSSVSPTFFGLKSFTELHGIKDVAAILKARPIQNGVRYVRRKTVNIWGLPHRVSCYATLTHRMKTRLKALIIAKMSARTTKTTYGAIPRSCWRQISLKALPGSGGRRILSGRRAVGSERSAGTSL